MAEKDPLTGRCVVILEPVSKRVNISKGKTVYDALVALNFPIGAFCGGTGTCGKCKIKVIDTEVKLSPPSDREIKKLGKQAIADGFRLACQALVQGDSRVYLTDTLLPKGNRILVDSDISHLGIKIEGQINPAINAKTLVVQKASLATPVADLNRLLAALGEDPSCGLHASVDDTIYDLAKVLPDALRSGDGTMTAFFRRFKANDTPCLFDVAAGDKTKDIFGLAVDIGTTTIVGYLINLISGELVAISALLNPQVAIGEDVISRITYVARNDGAAKAQSLVTGAVNDIIADTCKKGGIPTSDVKDVVVVGNTAMHHLFFGLPTKYLAVSPFAPVFKAPANVRARILGLRCNPNAIVYTPPVIAGFVGTDTVGCVVASRIDQYEKYTLLIDIGTNGELVLGNRNGLITGSCAAGSALEGAQISFGMRAADGAIEAVNIDPVTLEPRLQVIGNTTPIGICGSGLIDIAAELLRSRAITRSGRFNTRSEIVSRNSRFVKKGDEYNYILFDPSKDAHNVQGFDGKIPADAETITISQEDIRQLQLAKGAFLVGALLLLEKEQKKPADIEQVVLAGAFGSYINKENAAFIGLFPEVPPANIFQIGNAAGLGAQICLKNINMRDLANDMAVRMRYHEISTAPSFQVEYAHSLYFPHFKLQYFPSISKQYADIPMR
nr:ASKHA domain-containing protein [Candidatus Sigynarchaeota archaeon]